MAEVDELGVLETAAVVFDDVFARVAGRFPRFESRRQARLYAWGLVGAVERKNSWELAEHAGDGTSDRMQKLLNVAAWDELGVRADVTGRRPLVRVVADEGRGQRSVPVASGDRLEQVLVAVPGGHHAHRDRHAGQVRGGNLVVQEA